LVRLHVINYRTGSQNKDGVKVTSYPSPVQLFYFCKDYAGKYDYNKVVSSLREASKLGVFLGAGGQARFALCFLYSLLWKRAPGLRLPANFDHRRGFAWRWQTKN